MRSGASRSFAVLLGTRLRRAALALTAVLGLLAAVAAALQDAADFATVAELVQAATSTSLPFLGAGLALASWRDQPAVPRTSAARAVGLTCLAGLATGLYGSAVAAVAVLATGLPWGPAVPGTVAASLVVQVLAGLVGTGSGFLVPRAWLAGLLTVVVPLGCYLLLAGTAAQGWLTPWAAAQALLDGVPSRADWGRELVVLALWGVGLNVLGVLLRPPARV